MAEVTIPEGVGYEDADTCQKVLRELNQGSGE